MDPAQDTVILPGRSSPLLGLVFVLGGLALLGLSGMSAFENTQTSGGITSYSWSAFLFVFGGLLLQSGRLIAAEKGGIHARGHSLFLPGRSYTDRPSIAMESISHLQAIRRTQLLGDDEIVRWELELRLRDGESFLLAEANRFDELLPFGRHFSDTLSIPFQETAIFESPRGQGEFPLPKEISRQSHDNQIEYAFRVHRGWGLSAILPPMGILSFWVGAVLMAHVSVSPIAGFLFGPPLAFLGFLILCVSMGKRLSKESLSLSEEGSRHQVRIAGFSMSRRELLREDSPVQYVRIRPAGARGASLEMVGESKTFPMANGITSTSKDTDFSSLLRLCASINGDLLRTQKVETGDPTPE